MDGELRSFTASGMKLLGWGGCFPLVSLGLCANLTDEIEITDYEQTGTINVPGGLNHRLQSLRVLVSL